MDYISKEEIRAYILEVSKKLFLEKGYLNTSIRDIAKEGQITVGRIYVYFKKKDDIFIEIIKPILSNVENMTYSDDLTEEVQEEKIANLYSKERFRIYLDKSFQFINQYKEEFKLALFQSEGFHKVDVRQEIIKAYTKNHKSMLKILKKRGYIKEEYFNESYIHTMAKLYISIYEEFIAKDMTEKEYKDYMEGMVDFLYYGNMGVIERYKNE